MSKRLMWLIVFLVLVSFFTVSCSGATTSTSIGGAKLEMGFEYDDDLYIVDPQTSFAVGETFIISFDNNAPFEVSVVTIQVELAETKEYYGEISFNVDPMWTIMVTEPVDIGDPGKFKVSAIVDGKVRATQDLIIN